MLDPLIDGELGEAGPGDQPAHLVLVPDIQVEAAHEPLGGIRHDPPGETFRAGGRERKDDREAFRKTLPADQGKTEGPEHFPAGIFFGVIAIGEVFRPDPPVDGECVKGDDPGFLDKKPVEGVSGE